MTPTDAVLLVLVIVGLVLWLHAPATHRPATWNAVGIFLVAFAVLAWIALFLG